MRDIPMRRPVLALLLLLALPAGAAAEGAGVLTRAPTLVREVPAVYPPDAAAAAIEGEVELEIDVGDDGKILDVRVSAPAGHGFDEAAVEAARQFEFTPAEIDGKPAPVTLTYRTRFALAPPPEAEAAAGLDSPAVLRGRVIERGSKAPVAGATVDAGDGAFVTHTDGEGRFELSGVSPGPLPVVVDAPGYARYQTDEIVEAGKATEVTYYLRTAPTDGLSATVVGKREKKDVATVSLSAGEIRKIPGVSGDTVKVVQNLPGVARPPALSGQLVVRGGNQNDTKVYVDGQEVPLVFHFGGVTSVYPGELLDRVEFEPGNFGVRYGRATAGRVELVTRDPKPDRLHLLADASLYGAQAFGETAVSEDVSVALSARRSYVDGVLVLALENLPDGVEAPGFSVAPRFYDWQGKALWKLGEKDRLRFSVYGSDDRVAVVGLTSRSVENITSASTQTGFTRGQVTWDHQVSDRTRTKVLVGQGLDVFDIQAGAMLFRMDSYVTTVRAEGETDAIPDALTLAAGIDFQGAVVEVATDLPGVTPPGQIPSPNASLDTITMDRTYRTVSPGLWVEATWKPLPGLTLVPGLRFDYESFLGRSWLDPRLAARYVLDENTTLKGGIGLYHQPPLVQMATEDWGNPDLGEEAAMQYALGAERRIAGPLVLDLQLYWKELFDLALATDRTTVRNGRTVPLRYVNEGTGRAYGLEVLLRYDPDGRFFGWIAYSLSRSERDQHILGGTFVTGGDAYDQPHNLIALGTLELPEVWDGLSVGARFRWASGNPFREVVGSVYDVDADDYRRLSTETRDLRLPDFLQLDVRVDKKWTYDTWAFSAYLDVMNVTNRQNPEGVDYNFDYTERGWGPGLPIFPSFGIRAEY
jgi:TonB family protein